MNRKLGDFEGIWHLNRTIRHADGTQAHFIGQCSFTPRGGGMDYQETGVLTLPGAAPFEAQQSYRWGRGMAVTFPNGRAFHRVPPQGGPVAHWCKPDQYDGTYDFAAWPDWTLTWTVQGPRKDYTSVTHYRR
ncbi:MAG: DUF6314 family protein [Pseudomonadota bacterium]